MFAVLAFNTGHVAGSNEAATSKESLSPACRVRLGVSSPGTGVWKCLDVFDDDDDEEEEDSNTDHDSGTDTDTNDTDDDTVIVILMMMMMMMMMMTTLVAT